MNMQIIRANTAALIFALLVFSMVLTSTHTIAKSTVVAVEGTAYNVNMSMIDNLKYFLNKRVQVTLDSGKNFTGSVKAVGQHLLHLEKLVGKEYYDALIRIERIEAIDTRFRTIKR